MEHMFLTAVRARLVECHLCIQNSVAGGIGSNALVIEYRKTAAFKYLVFTRADEK